MKLHERFSTLSPIYSGGLTNHLPMMITALRLLDVEEEVIELISKEYVEKKNIVDLSNSGIENDPFNDEYIRLTNYFLQEMKHHGVEEIMYNTLSSSSYSLHSGLFHGIIRIAYAYMENNELLIAQGLAYFDLIKSELKLEGKVSENLQKDFENLVSIRKKDIEIRKTRTMDKVQIVLENDDVLNNLFYPKDILKYKEGALELFVEYFNKTKDFYILHVITGYHALHVLTQFFENQESTFNNFFMQSLVIMLLNPHDSYIARKVEQYSFYELYKEVPNLKDAHDIKLFLSLSYFYERYDMESLKEAANLIISKTKS